MPRDNVEPVVAISINNPFVTVSSASRFVRYTSESGVPVAPASFRFLTARRLSVPVEAADVFVELTSTVLSVMSEATVWLNCAFESASIVFTMSPTPPGVSEIFPDVVVCRAKSAEVEFNVRPDAVEVIR